MEVKDLSLCGAKLIIPDVFHDERGFFLQTHQEKAYRSLGIETSFVQDNHSYSRKKSLRGMHFQRYPGQAKLIYVPMGEIYDVIVDMRQNSPTFMRWEGVYLDDKMRIQLFIPAGFAHGFCILSKEAHVFYKVSTPYNSKEERGFRFDDPSIGIQWPVTKPILSKRDKSAPSFQEVIKT